MNGLFGAKCGGRWRNILLHRLLQGISVVRVVQVVVLVDEVGRRVVLEIPTIHRLLPLLCRLMREWISSHTLLARLGTFIEKRRARLVARCHLAACLFYGVGRIVAVSHVSCCWHPIKPARIELLFSPVTSTVVGIRVSGGIPTGSIVPILRRTSRLLNLGIVETVIRLKHYDLVIALIVRILRVACNAALRGYLTRPVRISLVLMLRRLIFHTL